ncbi:MAG TPA: L,D-transpeptidase [Alphaproteobacteria bacterium]|nr:L,D-transpeptidase [Alphaproteobacteria bacterium]
MPTETRRKSNFTALICIVALPLLAAPAKAKEKQEANKILIVKSAHTMTLLSGGKMLKTYKVALGGVAVGQNAWKATTRRLRATT